MTGSGWQHRRGNALIGINSGPYTVAQTRVEGQNGRDRFGGDVNVGAVLTRAFQRARPYSVDQRLERRFIARPCIQPRAHFRRNGIGAVGFDFQSSERGAAS